MKDWIELLVMQIGYTAIPIFQLFISRSTVLITSLLFLTQTTLANFVKDQNFVFKIIDKLMMKCTRSSRLSGINF